MTIAAPTREGRYRVCPQRHGAAIAIINDTDSFVIGGPSNALEAYDAIRPRDMLD
jgi:hypothetical protein